MFFESLLNITKKTGKQTLVEFVYRVQSIVCPIPIAIVTTKSHDLNYSGSMYNLGIFSCASSKQDIELNFKSNKDVILNTENHDQCKQVINTAQEIGYKTIRLVDEITDHTVYENHRQALILDLCNPFSCDDILSWANREVKGKPFIYSNQPKIKHAYSLCIGCMIRNSANRLQEWIEHYLSEGVDHFFIVNHLSTDNYLDVLKPYRDQITLWKTSRSLKFIGGNITHPYMENNGKKSHLQRYINTAIYEYASHHTKWIAMLDHDEFLWSKSGNLYSTIEGIAEDKLIIYIPWRTFYGDKPEISSSVIYSCTNRFKNDQFKLGKSIVNTTLPYQGLWHIHKPNMLNSSDLKILDIENYNLGLNHYRFPSAKSLKQKQSVGGMYGKAYRRYGKTIKDIQGDSNDGYTDNTLLNLHIKRGIACHKSKDSKPISASKAPLGNAIFRREVL